MVPVLATRILSGIFNFDVRQELMALEMSKVDNEIIAQNVVAIFAVEDNPDKLYISSPSKNRLLSKRKNDTFKQQQLHTTVPDLPKNENLVLLGFSTLNDVLQCKVN